ncbi:retrotransposon protein, putative, ty1-copia subclass, partial [Tanacetum coccineum]
MRALLIQHGCEAALEVLPADMEAQAKADLNKKAHSVVILCLGNKVLREVTGETTTARVWSKLETLYMTKSLANKLYLKKKLYTFYMPARRKISELIDEFNKIVLDLANIEEKFKDEDLGFIITHFFTSIIRTLCGYLALWTGFFNFGGRDGHTKFKGNQRKVMKVMSAQALLDWIMDSGCSYHMTPRLDILFDFLECDGGNVQLGDNRECKIRGIGKVRIQLRVGLSFVLHNVRYIPELKRNLISLRTLEKVRFTIKLQSGKVKVINGSRVVLSGIRRDNCIYSLDGHAMAGEPNASVEEKDRGLGLYPQIQTRRIWKVQRVEAEFEQLCIESGIARHLTVVGMPLDGPRPSGRKRHAPAYLINMSLSTAIEKKDTCKLDLREVKCILLGYPGGVKGYRLYRLDNESPKIVTSKNVVANESVMYKDTLKDSDAFADKSVEELHVEEDGDDKNAEDQETDQTPDITYYQLARDREPRTRTKPLRFQDENNMVAYAFVAAEKEDTHEPLTYQETVACEESSKWKDAMKEEMDSLRKNKTWELVDHPAGQKLVSYKWLFKIKGRIKGAQKPRYKARLVARGFTQRAGINYNEVFSLVVRHTSIRVILALTTCKDYELEQLDVKTTFLHGNLEEVICMRHPPGYKQGNKVCLLKKSVYGLKQSPRQWYRRFDKYMLINEFKHSSYDS